MHSCINNLKKCSCRKKIAKLCFSSNGTYLKKSRFSSDIFHLWNELNAKLNAASVMNSVLKFSISLLGKKQLIMLTGTIHVPERLLYHIQQFFKIFFKSLIVNKVVKSKFSYSIIVSPILIKGLYIL